jgi:hypothetical protein
MTEELDRRDNTLLREVLQKLNTDVIPGIADLRVKVEVMNTILTASCEDVKNLQREIGGNGKPGLKTEVELIKKWMDSQTWWQRTIVVAVIGNVIALIFTMIELTRYIK